MPRRFASDFQSVAISANHFRDMANATLNRRAIKDHNDRTATFLRLVFICTQYEYVGT
jgi:hypothetical protein